MTQTIHDTLLHLFECVRLDPELLPVVPSDDWQEDSEERRLLASFRAMMEQVQQKILQLKQTEEQLRESEEQYRSVFEASTDGLFIQELDNARVVEVNPAACKMHGFTHEEFLGLLPPDFIHPDSFSLVTETLQTIQSGGQYHAQGIAKRKDGTPFNAEAHVTTFTYKGRPHLLSVTRDITNQVRMEQQLREKEEQYRSIFEATSDGLIIRDMAGFVVEANPAACNMHGYAYEEFLGLHRTDIIDPKDRAMVAEYMKVIRDGHSFLGQAVDLRKDGTPFPVEVRGTTFTYQGKPHTLSVLRDVTERVEAERQLRESEEQYRSVFEATYDGLAILDPERCYVEVNPTFCQMFGYTHDELIGMHVSALAPPISQPNIIEAIEAFKAGRDYHTIGEALRKDGTLFVCDARSTLFIYRGQPHILVVARDITERVEADKQLREREEQYRSIFEATSDGLIIRNMDGAVVQVNPAACKMHGYSYEEYMALSRSTLIHPDYHPELREIIQTVKAGRAFQGQAVDLRKDGSTFPVEFRSDTFMYLGQPHMLTVLRDITERVEGERLLREREEQYRSIFEATSDAVFIMDLEDGHIIEANPAACNIYGYSYEEFIGLPPDAVIHPDQLSAFREHGLPAIRAGGNRHIQGVNLRKDGSPFPIDLHQTVFTYQGKPHILSVMRDITEQAQAQQLLEQRVEERTRELSTLLEVSHNVASTLELKPLLNLILNQIKGMVGYTAATILILDEDELVIVDYLGPVPHEAILRVRYPVRPSGVDDIVLRQGEPVIIDDVYASTPLAQDYREAVSGMLDIFSTYLRALMVVPLKLKDRVIGMLSLSSSEVGSYTPHQASLIVAIANQAAIAIENARLYAQAQELAALEERQKLARELHDSVSQALYGISLGAHAARTALTRDPQQVAEPLDYVLSLAEAALVEMRALIFELRPESLETEGLISALTKQAAALQARHEIAVSTHLCEEPNLPLPVKQELYRIAQEAMHNIVKHAHANHVDLRLDQTVDGVLLEVRDDGTGFDTAASFPGHLGLHSMRERIASLGGTFEIESAPDAGTRICVRAPGGG